MLRKHSHLHWCFLSLSLIFQQVKIEAQPWKVGSKKITVAKNALFRRNCFIWVTLSYLRSLSVSLSLADIFMCSLYHSREFIFNLLPSVDLIVSKFGLTIQHGQVGKMVMAWWEAKKTVFIKHLKSFWTGCHWLQFFTLSNLSYPLFYFKWFLNTI